MRETSLVTHHASRIRGCQPPEFLKNLIFFYRDPKGCSGESKPLGFFDRLTLTWPDHTIFAARLPHKENFQQTVESPKQEDGRENNG